MRLLNQGHDLVNDRSAPLDNRMDFRIHFKAVMIWGGSVIIAANIRDILNFVITAKQHILQYFALRTPEAKLFLQSTAEFISSFPTPVTGLAMAITTLGFLMIVCGEENTKQLFKKLKQAIQVFQYSLGVFLGIVLGRFVKGLVDGHHMA